MFMVKNLNYFIKVKKYSVRQINKELGISTGNIYGIINGRISEMNLSLGTVVKLANYFNVSLDDFVFKDLSLENKNCGNLPQSD